MRYFKYIITLPKLLNIALIISILSIMLIEVYLIKIPELFSYGSEFGKVYYKICLSIIASYIFYFIVVHIKSINDKENINIYIEKKVSSIIDRYKLQINNLKENSACNVNDIYFSMNDIDKLFKINLRTHDAPLILQYQTSARRVDWLEYFLYYNNQTKNDIKKILVHIIYLDSELVNLISHIDDCKHFENIELVEPLKNTEIASNDFLYEPFLEYSNLIEKLEEYYERKLIKYKI